MNPEDVTADIISAADDGKIVCQIDNARVHSIQLHIRENHPDWTIDRYKAEFPDAPLLSEKARDRLRKRELEKKANAQPAQVVTNVHKAHLHEIFDLGEAGKTKLGTPIEITVLGQHNEEAKAYIPDTDPNYVFDIDLVKKVAAAFELGFPLYLWGMHGTGKTTVLEQVSARTKRPFMRVQHTINTEESHILGQYVVKDGATEFQLGPLPMAMLYGWNYCADEYDFAMPSVTAVYQPVLEGKNLVIKEAPLEHRVIKPHPNFRFMATGNTNGIGDETGLYQGTLIQNAANFSRFKITEEVRYMDSKVEELVVMSQAMIEKADAAKIVKFANQIREQFADGKIAMTISPRELINASQLAMVFGGSWRTGIDLAYANRLSRIDRKVVGELAQRIWG